MGRHSTPRGEYSSQGQPNASPRKDDRHEGKHRKENEGTRMRLGNRNVTPNNNTVEDRDSDPNIR